MTHTASSNTVYQQHPVSSAQRAQLKRQQPVVLWFTGLSGSGKSTLAGALEQALWQANRHTYVLDGDNVRHGLCGDLGFSQEDRAENLRRVAHSAALMLDAGLIVLSAFISPSREERQRVRKIIGSERFIEVHVATPIEVCESRDPKGLYAKARRGEIPNFTGISAPYQEPLEPELRLDTSKVELPELVQQLMAYLNQRGILDEAPVDDISLRSSQT
ncbi:adenylyl-sulfate kinase [Paraferrimonas sedimenticola]|uniref:Adenylyl-sulfate kinase n=1 Tax=Paraferrimonas sedimenticola TaxID=375674 RepID=A0AA37VU51_9GAMM|nr:adenylyl-sulfate kinase [Paraferrimonas sedimenticola]GLP95649.1 adenylyl-sulfate kinase [Paraferrimonas sedimenticola]